MEKEIKNSAIEFEKNNISKLQKFRISNTALVVITILALIGGYAYNYYGIRHAKEVIYIVDQGSVLEAQRADNMAQRDLEAIDHLTRFHELFYNLAPNVTTINQNLERAMELADGSAYTAFENLKEQRYYTSLIDLNASQQILVDSVVVDISRYPYRAEVFSMLYYLRETTISEYTLHTTCILTEVERTRKNPHGLMIGKFYADKPKLIQTKNR